MIITSPLPPLSASSPTPLPLKDIIGIPKVTYKNPDWKPNEMDVDGLPSQTLHLALTSAESSQMQHMEEEPESIDLGGLDMFELEQVCRKKEYDKIQVHQLSTLEVIISRAYQQQQLGIYPGSQWDGNFLPKDSKKCGRKTDLQRTIAIGKILVDSGRYAKLTKY